ncbi:PD-(D/E)XK nuclease family protein [Hymenobacter sublimis]|uniref:PD-(D/E)XK nuclease family protein n=1 Tax=Hymenobacter sublimis TaxID=2933777 RepID=A0ABY4JEL0_9BACT|nr:PD-(D/E)XK nuclease family protein [Hymenobacter sublimis]UPL50222.1 PD-(D/E)XK nuclease family protein [Hymenobacter sublimis]
MTLFERLYRYREKEGKHERENYLTELLAAVLERNPALCLRLCEYAGLSVPANTKFSIRTQVSYVEGQPDIVLESAANGVFLLIECKLEAGEGHEQLKRYQRILVSSSAQHKRIIFLTKYFESPNDTSVSCLRWYQLFSFLAPLPAGDLLTAFTQYLTLHQLHKPMNFLPADLVALEQIQSTIAKMDEVLSPLEWLFREYLGGTGQYTKTRTAKLAEGWYGYWRYIGSSRFSAGFQFAAGEMPWCFIEVESWNCAAEPTATGPNANKVQQALRESWGISAEKLTYLSITKAVTSFTSNEDDGVVAMREWFKTHFEQMNAVLKQHEYFWKGVPEAVIPLEGDPALLQ